MPRIVISDSSPLHYLLLIGCGEVLPALYSEVIIPEAVAEELQRAATPALVRRWIVNSPSWLQVVTAPAEVPSDDLGELDRGEREAILLAVKLKADLVLMDDREGRPDRVGVSDCATASDKFPRGFRVARPDVQFVTFTSYAHRHFRGGFLAGKARTQR